MAALSEIQDLGLLGGEIVQSGRAKIVEIFPSRRLWGDCTTRAIGNGCDMGAKIEIAVKMARNRT